jgi:hypothetical protein
LASASESQQTNAARSRTALSSSRARGAHERARPEPLAAQHRIARGRDRDDHVGVGGLAVALGRLGADFLAELREPLGRPAVRDRLLDRRHGLADARDLCPGLGAAADHAQRPCARPGQVLRRHRARGARAELTQPVGLDHGKQLTPFEEHDHESDAFGTAGVRLHAGKPALVVHRGHHRQEPALEPDPVARDVLDRAGLEPQERVLDRGDRLGRREQPADVGLCQREGQGPSLGSRATASG